MSELIELPHAFVRQCDSGTTDYKSAGSENRPVLLRNDHVVLWAIDALLALHTALVRWRSRRRTFRALAGLDEKQRRDVGLTRGCHQSYRALAELDDTQFCHLSERGLPGRRSAKGD